MGSQHFLMFVEGTADAAFAVDAHGRISAWNTAAVELFGLSEAEAVSAPCHEILQCSDENGTVCSEHCIVKPAMKARRPLRNFDLRLQTKDGKLWCNLSTLIAREPASGALHAIHLVRPCETRKRLEQALTEFVRTQSQNHQVEPPAISRAPVPRVNLRLTAREVEVLRRLAEGHSTKVIANQLNISCATVNNHIKHILTKLNVHSRLEAIRQAERAGVI